MDSTAARDSGGSSTLYTSKSKVPSLKKEWVPPHFKSSPSNLVVSSPRGSAASSPVLMKSPNVKMDGAKTDCLRTPPTKQFHTEVIFGGSPTGGECVTSRPDPSAQNTALYFLNYVDREDKKLSYA